MIAHTILGRHIIFGFMSLIMDHLYLILSELLQFDNAWAKLNPRKTNFNLTKDTFL